MMMFKENDIEFVFLVIAFLVHVYVNLAHKVITKKFNVQLNLKL